MLLRPGSWCVTPWGKFHPAWRSLEGEYTWWGKWPFQQLRKMSWGNGRHLSNLEAPCLPGVNTQWEWESLKSRLPAGFCEGWDLLELSKGSACITTGLGDRRACFVGRMVVGKSRRKTCGHLLWRQKKGNRKDMDTGGVRQWHRHGSVSDKPDPKSEGK